MDTREDDDREMFANDVFEVASRRNAPVGVDDESFFGCFQVVLVVLVVTSNGHVIGDVVVENVPNGKTFRSSSSSFRLFLSIISIVIVHGPHVRVCTRLSLLKSSKGTEKSRNVATVASVKIPSANMASFSKRP